MKDIYISESFSVRRIMVNKNSESETRQIEGEIERLHSEFSKTQPFNDSQWDSSVLKVLFKNEAFARKYRIKIERFLKDLLEEGEEFTIFHPSHSNGEKEIDDNDKTFQIDISKNETLDKIEHIEKIPVYSSTFEDTLNNDKDESNEAAPEEDKPSQMTCFNCLGNHHLKKCPEKVDRNRINANKKELLSNVRYHTEEVGIDSRPGIVSNELRNALGLRSDQLPLFIYHMRIIGYPPGWMNEAVFENSGLSLYDSEGKATNDEKSGTVSGSTIYDGTKFIEFPGFNTPVPEGFTDEFKVLKMPSIQSHQQLKEALKSPNIIMSTNVYKRKQITSDDVESKKSKNDIENYKMKSEQVSEDQYASSTSSGSNFGYQTPDKKSDKRHSLSISKSPGTPILTQGNPYQRLPAADKFAKGITEHLPFENLPDSVGKYEKMRGVISEVQKKLNHLKSS